MENLAEHVKLMDWWIRNTHPDLYTHSNPAGIHFDLDGFLYCRDGQGAKAFDVADFYGLAIREISKKTLFAFLAAIHPQDDFNRMGIIPVVGMISYQHPEGVGIPYLLVELGNPYRPIKTGGINKENYLDGCGIVIITDQVTDASEILNTARILKSYGAGEVSSAVSLVAARQSADFLQTQGIDLLFSHEVTVADGLLKFNPNQRLLALTS